MYNRLLLPTIKKQLKRGKAIILIGPRQVGKTTLIHELLGNEPYLFLNADDPTTRSALTNPSTLEIKQLIGNHKTLFLDEAQRIPNIGITLKIITDQFKDVQLLVSGSSSFELANELNEPLTGRKWEYQLYPIAWEEFEAKHGYLYAEQDLENRLIYGFYPDVLNNPGEEKEILNQLVNSYLYKDILAFAKLRKTDILEKLVQALALQVGSEVNYNELAQLIGVDKNTIVNYIDILEKAFIVFRLRSYSGNVRNEIKKNRKIYFYDNGVRNTVIGQFNPLALRNDKGALWENFLMSERKKQLIYKSNYAKSYFWRTTQQQEVDYIEDYEGKITGYEFKWNEATKSKLPKTFLNNYQAEGKIVHRKNFREFLILP